MPHSFPVGVPAEWMSELFVVIFIQNSGANRPYFNSATFGKRHPVSIVRSFSRHQGLSSFAFQCQMDQRMARVKVIGVFGLYSFMSGRMIRSAAWAWVIVPEPFDRPLFWLQ